jgi:hypothetical protein
MAKAETSVQELVGMIEPGELCLPEMTGFRLSAGYGLEERFPLVFSVTGQPLCYRMVMLT